MKNVPLSVTRYELTYFMAARYDVTYFWLFVEFFLFKVVGATSSEGCLVYRSTVYIVGYCVGEQLNGNTAGGRLFRLSPCRMITAVCPILLGLSRHCDTV